MATSAGILTVTLNAVNKSTQGFSSFNKGVMSSYASLFSLAEGLRRSVQYFMDFETAMTEVSTIASDSTKSIEMLSKEVENLSIKYGVDATNAAKGLYQVISAGFRENPMDVLNVAIKASIAGLTSVESAVSAITTVLNVYNKKVTDSEEVSDLLFRAVELGVLRFNELSVAVGIAGQTTKNLGVPLEDLIGAMVTLTKNGVQAKMAMTQLRSVSTALLNPSKDMERIFAAVGRKLNKNIKSGKEFVTASGGIVQAMNNAFNAANDLDLSLFRVIRRKEALNALLSVSGDNLAQVAEDMMMLGVNTNATNEALAKMMNTSRRKFAIYAQKTILSARIIGGGVAHLFESLITEISLVLGLGETSIQDLITFITVAVTNGWKLIFAVTSRLVLKIKHFLLLSFDGIAKDFSRLLTKVSDYVPGAGAMAKGLDSFFGGSVKIAKRALKKVDKELADWNAQRPPLIDPFDLSSKNKAKMKKHAAGYSAAIWGILDNFSDVGEEDGGTAKKSKSSDMLAKRMFAMFRGAKRRLDSMLRRDGEKLGDSFKAAINTAQESLKGAFETAKRDRNIEAYKDKLKELFDIVLMKRREINDENKKTTEGSTKQVDILGQQVTLVGALAGGFSNLKSLVEGMSGAENKALQSMIAMLKVLQSMLAIKKAMKNLEGKSPLGVATGVISGIGGIFGGLAGFPAFHNGGYVQKFATGGNVMGFGGDNVPAMLQSGEYVLSRNAVQELGGRGAAESLNAGTGAGTGTNVNLNVHFDPDNFRNFITRTDEGQSIIRNAIVEAFPT